MPRELPPWLELYPADNSQPAPAAARNSDAQASSSTSAATGRPLEPSETDNLLPFNTMSSDSTPISPAMFALAVKDLPVDTLYAKAAELQNNIVHLTSSNAQLLPFAEDGDEICKEAIAENDVVIQRMEERVGLCKVEVENRGLVWTGHADTTQDSAEKTNGLVNGDTGREGDGETGISRALSGRLTDEELRRQLEAQMGDDDEDGVHL